MLTHSSISSGMTAKGNVVDYHSAKIVLSTVSSYDAELHACTEACEMAENTQATLAEISAPSSAWSISPWLTGNGPRVPVFVVIDAKGLWTKIQAEHKTEKRGTIYVRRMMEILNRIGAKVYWVNS